MNSYFCHYGRQVAQLLREGLWPSSCDLTLLAHAESCPFCLDLVLVQQTLKAAGAESAPVSSLPSAGVLWWRGQLRLRREAVEQVTRPIVLAEKLVFFSILFAFGVVTVRWHAEMADWFYGLTDLISSGNGNPLAVLLLTCGGMVVVLGGFAAYLLKEKT